MKIFEHLEKVLVMNERNNDHHKYFEKHRLNINIEQERARFRYIARNNSTMIETLSEIQNYDTEALKMKYARQYHQAMLPYYYEYKKAIEEIEKLENKDFSNVEPLYKDLEKAKNEISIKMAREKARVVYREMYDAIEYAHTTMKEKFTAELGEEFTYKVDEIDPNVAMLLNSKSITPLDFVSMYNNASTPTNKRLIAERADEYNKENRGRLEVHEARALSMIAKEGAKFSPYAALTNFESIYNAYMTYARASTLETSNPRACTIIRNLPKTAEQMGLSMTMDGE